MLAAKDSKNVVLLSRNVILLEQLVHFVLNKVTGKKDVEDCFLGFVSELPLLDIILEGHKNNDIWL
jgi:hypothetical protein